MNMSINAINPKHDYQQVSLDEEAAKRESRYTQSKESNFKQNLCIAFLAFGWTATAAYGYYTRPRENGPLHVYTNTPIPKEVFNPVKRIFGPDERYVGDGSDVNHYWDKLVTGYAPRCDNSEQD
jgi:hypothetical protein